jgi:hypothetical protein
MDDARAVLAAATRLRAIFLETAAEAITESAGGYVACALAWVAEGPDFHRIRRTLRNLQSDALNCTGTSPGYAVGHLPSLNSNLIEIAYECCTCNRALNKDAPPIC